MMAELSNFMRMSLYSMSKLTIRLFQHLPRSTACRCRSRQFRGDVALRKRTNGRLHHLHRLQKCTISQGCRFKKNLTIELFQCVSRNMADRVGQTGHQTAGIITFLFIQHVLCLFILNCNTASILKKDS
jgi:hypothetical protein